MTNVGLLMTTNAGHVAHVGRLRDELADRAGVDVAVAPITYWDDDGRYERLLPGGLASVLRGRAQARSGMRAMTADRVITSASAGAWVAGALRKMPSIYDTDATPAQLAAMPAYADVGGEDGVVGAIRRRLTLRLFRSVSVITAWSAWARDSVIADYGIQPDKVVVNPPGLDLDAWTVSPRAASASATDPLRVLFVGGDFARKGGDDLLAWFRAAGRDDIELDIVTRSAVDSGPGVRVHTGLSPEDLALRDLYAKADVFVMPSRGECFGIASIEAMAAGLPVVQTTVGGAADIVDDGATGHLVAPADPAALGRAIASFADDRAAAARMGAAARVRAEARFDIRTTASRMLDLLDQAASGNLSGWVWREWRVRCSRW